MRPGEVPRIFYNAGVLSITAHHVWQKLFCAARSVSANQTQLCRLMVETNTIDIESRR
jgi:hypothetical protein